jgi:hypothetical protein
LGIPEHKKVVFTMKPVYFSENKISYFGSVQRFMKAMIQINFERVNQHNLFNKNYSEVIFDCPMYEIKKKIKEILSRLIAETKFEFLQ